MSDLNETGVWEDGIYQIETSDPVLGGPPDLEARLGIANIQALQLANRTGLLRGVFEHLVSQTNSVSEQSLAVQVETAILALASQVAGQLETDAVFAPQGGEVWSLSDDAETSLLVYSKAGTDSAISEAIEAQSAAQGLANMSAAELACHMGLIITNQKATMTGFALLDDSVLPGGAAAYPSTAAAFPEYVSGDDLVLGLNIAGRYPRFWDPSSLVNPVSPSPVPGDAMAQQLLSHDHRPSSRNINSTVQIATSSNGKYTAFYGSGATSDNALSTGKTGGNENRPETSIWAAWLPLVA